MPSALGLRNADDLPNAFVTRSDVPSTTRMLPAAADDRKCRCTRTNTHSHTQLKTLDTTHVHC
eukprot:42649-Eustigmatos_ZCMA.PRE.1